MNKILFILTSLLLLGCSNNEKLVNLAQQDQWEQVGFIDGNSGHYQRGKPELEKLSMLTNNDYETYKKGYTEGVNLFCQPQRAYQHGLDGQEYQGQCVNTSEERLIIEEWQKGYDIYTLDASFLFNDD